MAKSSGSRCSIQQWGISSRAPQAQVVTGEKVVGLVIHGDPDEVVAIIDCLERQVAQIIEDTRAQEVANP